MADHRLFCPHCLEPHLTLRDVLSCHPRETRVYTGLLEEGGSRRYSATMKSLLGGNVPMGLYRDADAIINPATTKEVA